MKQASKLYRNAMKDGWRSGEWLLHLYMGLIRENFQATAQVLSEPQMSFQSDNYRLYIFDDRLIDERFASFEPDLVKADGSYIFTDSTEVESDLDYFGFISKELSDENGLINCQFDFNSKVGERGLRGLTLAFDEVYPTELTIICKSEGVEIFNKRYTNDDVVFITTDVFGDTADEMIVQIHKMNKPFTRFRLRYVLFGVGVNFTTDNFLTEGANLKSFMHPCSVALPTQDFSATIDNYGDDYNFDKDGSIVQLFTAGQDVIFKVGYQLENGTVETLPSTVLELNTFEVDQKSLRITAVDFLRNENTEVELTDPFFFAPPEIGNKLRNEYVLAKQNKENTIDNAEKIFETTKTSLDSQLSAGTINQDQYDEQLDNAETTKNNDIDNAVNTFTPIHNNIMKQLGELSTDMYAVANMIQNTVTNLDFAIYIDDSLRNIPMKFSHITTTTKEAIMMIASASRCIMDLKDKGLYIRRVDFSYDDTIVNSDDKTVNSDMDILTSTDAVKLGTFEPMRIMADGKAYFPGDYIPNGLKTGFISEAISDENGEFIVPPKIVIEDTKEAISPSYLNIKFNGVDIVKLQVTTYFNGEVKETLLFDNVNSDIFDVLRDFTAFNKMEISFHKIMQPHTRLYVSKASFDRYAYDITDELYENETPIGKQLDTIRNIIVSYQTSKMNEEGEFEDVVENVSIHCNEKGTDVEYNNPFITTEEVALTTGEWLKKYYGSQIQYDVPFIGDPSLEAYDLVKLESPYNENLLCDVENLETSFTNGGVRGKIIARRIEDAKMDKSEDRLAAYRLYQRR